MIKNPFKFGSVVEGEHFTNRDEEIKKVSSILNSSNHLVIISPRRFGKTSLIKNVISKLNRKYIYLDLQLITSVEDLSAELLKRVYRIFPSERFKRLIKSFRIIPTINLNPVNNEIDISFQATNSQTVLVEDVFNLLNKLSSRKETLIIVLDEFQSIFSIGKDLDKKLRAVIQHHQNINYVFLGSQESLMRDIFEKKKSPFYHFGYLLQLNRIPYDEFEKYLNKGFSKVLNESDALTKGILNITKSHPYYTQQLAFSIFELLIKKHSTNKIIDQSKNEIVSNHDIDFERLWNTLNRTDMKVLIGMTNYKSSPLSHDFNDKVKVGSSSTIFSSIKRLREKGILIQTESGYEIDDPFFREWIIKKRNL